MSAKRRLIWFEVTRHPTAEWLAQQIIEAFPWDSVPTFLVRDRPITQAYYNVTRTHLSLRKDAPVHRAIQRSGVIVATPILSGLHNRYARI